MEWRSRIDSVLRNTQASIEQLKFREPSTGASISGASSSLAHMSTASTLVNFDTPDRMSRCEEVGNLSYAGANM
jgi:hypothetical protein